MRHTSSDYETEALDLQDLKDEVGELRSEVRRLRREVLDLKRATGHASLSRGDSRDSRGPSEESESFHSPQPHRGGYRSEEQSVPLQSVREASPLSSGSAAPLQSVREASQTSAASAATPETGALSWTQREEICDEIGKFLARSISGQYRGTSGRSKIPLPSRLWIIVRDFWGQICSPVKVVRSWTSCKLLCKPDNHECGDSVFVGVPSEREARRVVLAAQLRFPQAVEQ